MSASRINTSEPVVEVHSSIKMDPAVFNPTKFLIEGVVYRPHLLSMSGEAHSHFGLSRPCKRRLLTESDNDIVSVKRRKICESPRLGHDPTTSFTVGFPSMKATDTDLMEDDVFMSEDSESNTPHVGYEESLRLILDTLRYGTEESIQTILDILRPGKEDRTPAMTTV